MPPDLGGQDDGRVDTDHVLARRHHVAPPLTLDVLLELDTQRSVVPGGTLAAVDLAAREYEATALAQADDGVDLVGGHGALFITTTGDEAMRSWRKRTRFRANASGYRRGGPSDQIGSGKETAESGQKPYLGLTTRLVDNRFQTR